MSIQIKAEFESVHAAENASRYLRYHLEGIERIHIVSRRQSVFPKNHSGDPDFRRDAILSVTVNEPAQRTCTGMMHHLGGMYIHSK